MARRALVMSSRSASSRSSGLPSSSTGVSARSTAIPSLSSSVLTALRACARTPRRDPPAPAPRRGRRAPPARDSDDGADALRLRLDVAQAAASRDRPRRVEEQELRRAEQPGQRVVNLVGHAGAEGADGGQRARAQQQLLGGAQLARSSPRRGPRARGSRRESPPCLRPRSSAMRLNAAGEIGELVAPLAARGARSGRRRRRAPPSASDADAAREIARQPHPDHDGGERRDPEPEIQSRAQIRDGGEGRPSGLQHHHPEAELGDRGEGGEARRRRTSSVTVCTAARSRQRPLRWVPGIRRAHRGRSAPPATKRRRASSNATSMPPMESAARRRARRSTATSAARILRGVPSPKGVATAKGVGR